MSEQNKQELQITEAPKPGSPEYNEAMAKRGREARLGADGAAGEEDNKPQRPDHIPEKFWDAEKGEVRVDELVKSNLELQKALTQKSQGKSEEEQEAVAEEADSAAQDIVSKAGLSWDGLGDKLVANGKLDDADYEALAKVGVPKALADDYIQMSIERVDRQTKTAIDLAGGEEAMTALLKWAGETLSKDEIVKYNQMLAGKDYKVAVQTLKTMKAEAKPVNDEPTIINGGRQPGSNNVIGYQDRAEQAADMKDPRYKSDPKFRAEVEKKTQHAAWRGRNAFNEANAYR